MVGASSLVREVGLWSGERLDGLRSLVGIAVVVKGTTQSTDLYCQQLFMQKKEKEKKNYGGRCLASEKDLLEWPMVGEVFYRIFAAEG